MDIILDPNRQKAAEEYLSKRTSHEIQEMNFVLPYDMSKKFRSLMLIEEDLKFISKAGEQLLLQAKDEAADHMILTCLWKSIVATYGKICTKSQSGFTSVGEGWFKGESSQLSVHAELMEWRHKFIAHREDSGHELSMAFIKVKKQRNKPEEKSYQIKAMAKVMPTITELKSYVTLFEYLLNIIPKKIDKEAGRVIGIFYAKGKDFLLHHLVDENHNPIYKKSSEQ